MDIIEGLQNVIKELKKKPKSKIIELGTGELPAYKIEITKVIDRRGVHLAIFHPNGDVKHEIFTVDDKLILRPIISINDLL